MKETIQELATLAAAALLTLMLVTSGTLAADKTVHRASCEFKPIGMVDEPMKLRFAWQEGNIDAVLFGNVGYADVVYTGTEDSISFHQVHKDKGLGVLIISTTTLNLPDKAPPGRRVKASHLRNFYIPSVDALNVSAYEGTCTLD